MKIIRVVDPTTVAMEPVCVAKPREAEARGGFNRPGWVVPPMTIAQGYREYRGGREIVIR